MSSFKSMVDLLRKKIEEMISNYEDGNLDSNSKRFFNKLNTFYNNHDWYNSNVNLPNLLSRVFHKCRGKYGMNFDEAVSQYDNGTGKPSILVERRMGNITTNKLTVGNSILELGFEDREQTHSYYKIEDIEQRCVDTVLGYDIDENSRGLFPNKIRNAKKDITFISGIDRDGRDYSEEHYPLLSNGGEVLGRESKVEKANPSSDVDRQTTISSVMKDGTRIVKTEFVMSDGTVRYVIKENDRLMQTITLDGSEYYGFVYNKAMDEMVKIEKGFLSNDETIGPPLLNDKYGLFVLRSKNGEVKHFNVIADYDDPVEIGLSEGALESYEQIIGNQTYDYYNARNNLQAGYLANEQGKETNKSINLERDDKDSR